MSSVTTLRNIEQSLMIWCRKDSEITGSSGYLSRSDYLKRARVSSWRELASMMLLQALQMAFNVSSEYVFCLNWRRILDTCCSFRPLRSSYIAAIGRLLERYLWSSAQCSASVLQLLASSSLTVGDSLAAVSGVVQLDSSGSSQ